MSLEALLDHTCDIYHIAESEGSPGFGLPSSPVFKYPETPDLSGVACHFAVKTSTVTTEQTSPANMLEARIKLTLPAGTDIRINDKIVWLENGTEYTAELPRDIRSHHRFAYLKRTSAQQPL